MAVTSIDQEHSLTHAVVNAVNQECPEFWNDAVLFDYINGSELDKVAQSDATIRLTLDDEIVVNIANGDVTAGRK